MTPSRQKVIDQMTLKGFSDTTQNKVTKMSGLGISRLVKEFKMVESG